MCVISMPYVAILSMVYVGRIVRFKPEVENDNAMTVLLK